MFKVYGLNKLYFVTKLTFFPMWVEPMLVYCFVGCSLLLFWGTFWEHQNSKEFNIAKNLTMKSRPRISQNQIQPKPKTRGS
jgi:hypothetical protein